MWSEVLAVLGMRSGVDASIVCRSSGADHHSCTGGARITTEGGSFKRDLRAGSVCMYVCLSVRHARHCDVT